MSIEQKEPKVQTQAAATQRRYRTLAVVRQEAITRVEKPLEDSVFVWPHLLVREFYAKPGQGSLVFPGIAGVAALFPTFDRWSTRAWPGIGGPGGFTIC